MNSQAIKASLLGITMFLAIISTSYNLAYAQQNITHGPPDNWEGHPPIHVKGNFGKTLPLTAVSQTQVTNAYHVSDLGCKLNTNDGKTTPYCGTGQTVVIIDAYDDSKIENDLGVFSSAYNLPACTTANGCFKKITPQGLPRQNSGWALEESLDVEWAHAIAPGAKIVLVEAASNSFSNLFGAINYANNNNLGNQITMSWGGSEFSGEKNYDTYFAKQGVSYFASSGDTGGTIIYPSASPNVVSVGGTTLTVDSLGNVISETAWSGSGGGVSIYESEPQYQKNINSPYTSGRATPDVSYDADPNTGFAVYDSVKYNGQSGWFQVGGTSAGAPQWAALSAIANSQRSSSMSSPDVALYNAAIASYATNFRDIISGTAGSFSAGTGYDLTTGLGSPLVDGLIPYLAAN